MSLTSHQSVLTQTVRDRFERDGFTYQPHLLPRADALVARDAAMAYADARMQAQPGTVFRQLVNVHPHDAVLRSLTFHPTVIAAVAELAGGRSMRVYHDQILIKDPKNGQASEFHQDRPYWPLEPGFTVSIWIALDDCPRERGCMSFIPGSHRKLDLPLQVICFPRDLFDKCPELEWSEQVIVPLQAGGATFHQGRTAHRAGPNETDTPRVAFSVIYVEADTRLSADAAWLSEEAKAGCLLPESVCPRIC